VVCRTCVSHLSQLTHRPLDLAVPDDTPSHPPRRAIILAMPVLLIVRCTGRYSQQSRAPTGTARVCLPARECRASRCGGRAFRDPPGRSLGNPQPPRGGPRWGSYGGGDLTLAARGRGSRRLPSSIRHRYGRIPSIPVAGPALYG
jgi:hypothetical protein